MGRKGGEGDVKGSEGLVRKKHVFLKRQEAEIGKEFTSLPSASEFQLWLLFFGALNDLLVRIDFGKLKCI